MGFCRHQYWYSGNIYYIDAAPVRAKNLDFANTVEVVTGDGTISFKHSALNYAIASIELAEKECATEKQIKDAIAMKAMYEYYVKVAYYLEHRQ